MGRCQCGVPHLPCFDFEKKGGSYDIKGTFVHVAETPGVPPPLHLIHMPAEIVTVTSSALRLPRSYSEGTPPGSGDAWSLSSFKR